MLLFIIVLCTSTNIVKQMTENLHVQVEWKILLALRKKVHYAFVQVCIEHWFYIKMYQRIYQIKAYDKRNTMVKTPRRILPKKANNK